MTAQRGEPAQDREAKRKALIAQLGEFLDRIDETTRLPGEKPLREAVAEQARQRLTKEKA